MVNIDLNVHIVAVHPPQLVLVDVIICHCTNKYVTSSPPQLSLAIPLW